MNFNLKNFSAQTTPVSIQAIGNFLLIIAAIGTGIVGLPATVPGFIAPEWLLSAGMWMMAIGSLGKLISKFFSVSDAHEVETLVDHTNKKLNDSTDNSVPTNPLEIKPSTSPTI